MEEAAVASKSKYQKLKEEPDRVVATYNIDDLPEAIPEHILSFVSMENAVRTCTLSKKREHFTNFVERVLVLPGSAHIKRFDLSCDVLGNASGVSLWVSTAVKWNVKECFVDLSDIQGDFVLPYLLVHLHNTDRMELSIPLALKLPSQICLANYKRSTEQPLSSPVLEELSIEDCTWDNPQTLTIHAPMLKFLIIPNKDFDCSPFLNEYQVENTCALLLEAHINVTDCCPSSIEQLSYCLNKLLEMIFLSSLFKYQFQMPLVLFKLLHNSLHCEALTFGEGIELPPNDKEEGVILDPAPPHFSSHIRQIQLFDLFPCEKKVCMLKLLLKHGTVLEKFMICTRWLPSEQGDEETFRKNLLEIHWGSKNLEIAFLDC
ncbi:hypothetical protein BT93_E2136 [Corymbia citriodora subsp. variegata]|nr:hypothetical protein BT93_E2136 [Corymbia citriodora subsp. variegata]